MPNNILENCCDDCDHTEAIDAGSCVVVTCKNCNKTHMAAKISPRSDDLIEQCNAKMEVEFR